VRATVVEEGGPRLEIDLGAAAPLGAPGLLVRDGVARFSGFAVTPPAGEGRSR
jgi:hypothetical protein